MSRSIWKTLETNSEVRVPQLLRYENSIEEVLGRVGLRKVFGVLSEIQRQILGLYLLDGYTFEEIAVKVDQTRGNVKHHYFRGLEKLRKQIFRQGD